jgi:hypothetical protein
MASAQSMCAEEGNHLSISEAHAAEDFANVSYSGLRAALVSTYLLDIIYSITHTQQVN